MYKGIIELLTMNIDNTTDNTKKWVKLQRLVLANSQSTDWDIARHEWIPKSRGTADIGDDYSCLCGHPHIVKLFAIFNSTTDIELQHIGSECIKRFDTCPMKDAVKLANRGNTKMREGLHAGKTFEWVYNNFPQFVSKRPADYSSKETRA